MVARAVFLFGATPHPLPPLCGGLTPRHASWWSCQKGHRLVVSRAALWRRINRFPPRWIFRRWSGPCCESSVFSRRALPLNPMWSIWTSPDSPPHPSLCLCGFTKHVCKYFAVYLLAVCAAGSGGSDGARSLLLLLFLLCLFFGSNGFTLDPQWSYQCVSVIQLAVWSR